MEPNSRNIEPTMSDVTSDGATDDHRDASDLNNEGIVSVNDHGRKSSNLAAKIGFLSICAAILVAGGLTMWNSSRAAAAKEDSAAKEAEKVENKPAAVGRPREFPDAAPAPLLVEVQTVDGRTVKMDTQGYVVPETQAAPLEAKGEPFGGAAQAGTQTRDRYSGEILVTSATDFQSPSPAPLKNGGTAEAYANVLSKVLDKQGGQAGSLQPASFTEEEEEPRSELDAKLQAGSVPTVTATKLGDRSLTLPKGKTIDCTLTSRIISELPGYVTCVLQSNVFSEDGRVVLLEKGSEATGEFGNTMVQGQHRIFVVWDRIKTPQGVLISLNSPGTDPLGTPGVPGFVDNRWFERIGSAFLLSIIKDAIAYELAEQTGGASGTYAFQESVETGNKMAEKVLDSTINLKPVLYKNQGETLAIFVSKDLDFGSVYKLTAR